jgi:predicted murein hydrolase (TIGR00659 family)
VQGRSGGWPLANPVLIAIVLIVAGLELCSIPYDTYLKGGGLIQFMLGPATVALALPIYANATRIRGAAAGIAAGVAVGATVACASAVGIAWLLGVPDDVLRSIASKSVTTPIAIGISQEIGGHPSLTAVLVITSGIIGAMLSGRLYDWIGLRDWEARGLATGIASHGIGTAQMLSVNETAGAFAGLAIGLTGLFTAIVLPYAAYLL